MFNNTNKSYIIAKNEIIEICGLVYELEYKNKFKNTIRMYKGSFNEHTQKIENEFVGSVLNSISHKCEKYLNIYLSNKGISLLIRSQLLILLRVLIDETIK